MPELDFIRSFVKIALPCAWIGLLATPAMCDKLYHVDGTVVEGKILKATPDEVRIETKYGTLTYNQSDLVKIERDADLAKQQATPKPSATPLNLAVQIPAGPVNPFAPPAAPALVQSVARLTSASLVPAAAPSHSPTPAAAATPAP